MALRCLFRLKNINLFVARSSTSLPCNLHRSFSIITREKRALIRRPTIIGNVQIRNKYDKKSSSTSEIEEESDEELDDDFDKRNIKKITVQSMRADLLLKSGIGIARNKIETSFYENRIRVNGRKIAKKSLSCSVGDEIDLIKEEIPANPNHILISRIEIISATPKEDGISVTMKRFKSLTVEKYEN